MEIRKEIEVKKPNYPEQSNMMDCQKMFEYTKIPAFSALLVSLLANSSVYGFNGDITIDLAGMIKYTPPYEPVMGVVQYISLIIALISLITTIIISIKMYQIRKLKETDTNMENTNETEKPKKEDLLKKSKKKLFISTIVFIIFMVLYLILDVIR